MRQESAGVTEALLDSARREFMEHGFHGASLRRISADSGVSTNSIYTRFGDKAGLFAAVVGPVADGLMEYYLTCVDQAADTQETLPVPWRREKRGLTGCCDIFIRISMCST